MELTVNCDLVIASENAKFALPEVSRGVVAAQGGIPRLSSIAGHQVENVLPCSLVLTRYSVHRRCSS